MAIFTTSDRCSHTVSHDGSPSNVWTYLEPSRARNDHHQPMPSDKGGKGTCFADAEESCPHHLFGNSLSYFGNEHGRHIMNIVHLLFLRLRCWCGNWLNCVTN